MPWRHLIHYIFLKEEQELTDFLEKWLLATANKKKSHLVVNTFKMSSGDICKLETNYFQVAYIQKQSAYSQSDWKKYVISSPYN